MATRAVSRHHPSQSPSSKRSPLAAPEKSADICLELHDHSTKRHSAIDFFRLRGLRDPQASAARLATQFVTQNQPLLDLLDVRIEHGFDGHDVTLGLHSGSAVGAIPLLSPTSARLDYGLVVQPRFPWPGIGPMLAEMGWRVSPRPLRLPLLKRSERRVPAWVLSSMVLARLQALLDTVDRRLDMAHEVVSAPRGRVDWAIYATRHLSRGQALQVPCAFPDLRADRQLLGADLREQHRHDLLQVLAYANLARTERVVACLAYPCSLASWRSLQERGRLMHRAEVGSAARRVELWLTAVPMTGSIADVAGTWANGIREKIRS